MAVGGGIAMVRDSKFATQWIIFNGPRFPAIEMELSTKYYESSLVSTLVTQSLHLLCCLLGRDHIVGMQWRPNLRIVVAQLFSVIDHAFLP